MIGPCWPAQQSVRTLLCAVDWIITYDNMFLCCLLDGLLWVLSARAVRQVLRWFEVDGRPCVSLNLLENVGRKLQMPRRRRGGAGTVVRGGHELFLKATSRTVVAS